MLRSFFGLFITFLIAASAWGSAFDVCLIQASRQSHRLDRIEAIQGCFSSFKQNLNSESCYNSVKKLRLHRTSGELNEQLKSLCFYEVSEFKNVDACIQKSRLFEIAINKDEAVFECYLQFQKNISAKQCLEISKKLIYPAKREHLETQCNNN